MPVGGFCHTPVDIVDQAHQDSLASGVEGMERKSQGCKDVFDQIGIGDPLVCQPGDSPVKSSIELIQLSQLVFYLSP